MRDVNRIPAYQQALQAAVAGALREVGDEALEIIDQSFERERTPTGTPWAPLAPATVERKGHDTILVEEGDLKESFDTEVQFSPLNKKLVVYSEDEKLKYHEYGTVNMPRRPIMGPLARRLNDDVLPDELETAAIAAETQAGVRGRPL